MKGSAEEDRNMGKAALAMSSRLLSLVVVVLMSACFVSALLVEEQEQSRPVRAVRRSFMGLSLMCQAHRRNCPGGFRKRLAPMESAAESEEAVNAPNNLMVLSRLLASYRQKIADSGDYEYRQQPQLPAFVRPSVLNALADRADLMRPRR